METIYEENGNKNMTECRDLKKCSCWNGCENLLKDNIERNEFYKEIRKNLARKRLKKTSCYDN